jgi:hypothetical protein
MSQNTPITSRYYPSLADLVDKKKVPAFLHNFLFDHYDDSTPPVLIKGALSKVHYRNLQFTKSSNGDSASYSLDLVSKEEIGYELPGGLEFVLNSGGNANISAFPITLQYQWAILGFIRDLDAASGVDFTDVLKLVKQAVQVFNLTGEELLANAFNLFVEPVDPITNKFDQILADMLTHYGSTVVLVENTLEELRTKIEEPTGFNNGIVNVIYDLYIDDSDAEVKKANFRKCFRIIAPNGIESYLKDVLIPKFSASLELSAGIKIPRNWAIPLHPDKTPMLEDEDADGNLLGTPKALFTFTKSKFSFNSERDQPFGIDADLALNPDDIVYVSIGKTGLIAGIKRLKIDTRVDRNIPEMAADGRPNSFKGVYVEEASVTFPPNWKVVGDKVVTARNLIVGNEGGVSGNFTVDGANEEYYVDAEIREIEQISIDYTKSVVKITVHNDQDRIEYKTLAYSVGTRDYYIRDKKNRYYRIDTEGEITAETHIPMGILEFEIGSGTKKLGLSLDSFNVNIRQNKVTNSSCVGTLTIPRDEGNLEIVVTVSFNEGFLVKAYLPNQQPLVDAAWGVVRLGGLELGKVAGRKHFAFSGSKAFLPSSFS